MSEPIQNNSINISKSSSVCMLLSQLFLQLQYDVLQFSLLFLALQLQFFQSSCQFLILHLHILQLRFPQPHQLLKVPLNTNNTNTHTLQHMKHSFETFIDSPAIENNICVFNLLRIDDLEPLLHLAALDPPALLICDQRDVRMLDALITVTAVHALTVLIVTKIIITEHSTTSHCHGNRAVALKARSHHG